MRTVREEWQWYAEPREEGLKLQPLVENLQSDPAASLNTLFHNSRYNIYICIRVSHPFPCSSVCGCSLILPFLSNKYMNVRFTRVFQDELVSSFSAKWRIAISKDNQSFLSLSLFLSILFFFFSHCKLEIHYFKFCRTAKMLARCTYFNLSAYSCHSVV